MARSGRRAGSLGGGRAGRAACGGATTTPWRRRRARPAAAARRRRAAGAGGDPGRCAGPSSPRALDGFPQVAVLQHGWQHANHARAARRANTRPSVSRRWSPTSSTPGGSGSAPVRAAGAAGVRAAVEPLRRAFRAAARRSGVRRDCRDERPRSAPPLPPGLARSTSHLDRRRLARRPRLYRRRRRRSAGWSACCAAARRRPRRAAADRPADASSGHGRARPRISSAGCWHLIARPSRRRAGLDPRELCA